MVPCTVLVGAEPRRAGSSGPDPQEGRSKRSKSCAPHVGRPGTRRFSRQQPAFSPGPRRGRQRVLSPPCSGQGRGNKGAHSTAAEIFPSCVFCSCSLQKANTNASGSETEPRKVPGLAALPRGRARRAAEGVRDRRRPGQPQEGAGQEFRRLRAERGQPGAVCAPPRQASPQRGRQTAKSSRGLGSRTTPRLQKKKKKIN